VSHTKPSCQEFFDRISRKGVVLVDFSADWSVPCNTQLPAISLISKLFNQKASVEIIDVDDQRKLATSLQITSIPTMILFKDGIEVMRFVGLQKPDVLSQALENMIG